MFKNFLESYWFNVIFAVLAGFFAVMQEVWIGAALPFVNVALLAVLAAIGISICAEIVKMICFPRSFSWKKVLIGGAAGSVVGLITLLLV